MSSARRSVGLGWPETTPATATTNGLGWPETTAATADDLGVPGGDEAFAGPLTELAVVDVVAPAAAAAAGEGSP